MVTSRTSTRRARAAALATTAAALVLAACGGGSPRPAASADAATAASGGTMVNWLCRPGTADDPCQDSLPATSVPAAGAPVVQPAPATTAAAAKFDCFYVYPTVVSGPGDNAGPTAGPVEAAVAVSQVSRFSPVCRIWAPVYRQRTAASEAKGLGNDPTADNLAYQSLLAGWEDYIDHYNQGRPFVLIGHSQGAAMLVRLLRGEIDGNASLRGRLVSALILGGNVQVPAGREVGGAFHHIPGCTSPAQTGCVIAYSTFPSEPPATAQFGRPGQGVSFQSDQTAVAGQQVLCTNPAALAGGSAPLEPYFIPPPKRVDGQKITTPWVTYPDRYRARCESEGGATWLQVTPVNPQDPRPQVTEKLGPDWGFHEYDVNLALGNLLSDVTTEESSYLAGHR